MTDGQGQTGKQIIMETGSENNYLTSSVSKVTAASRDWSCWNLVSSSYLTWLSALTSHTWNTQTNLIEHCEGSSSTNQWDVVRREKSNKGFIGCEGNRVGFVWWLQWMGVTVRVQFLFIHHFRPTRKKKQISGAICEQQGISGTCHNVKHISLEL